MITTNNAQRLLSDSGLATLGLASPVLSAHWTTATTDAGYLPGTLAVRLSAPWCAPFTGLLGYRASRGTPEFTGLDGAPVAAASAAVLRLHPQAHLRLEALYARRYGGATSATDPTAAPRSLRPVPHALVINAPAVPDMGQAAARAVEEIAQGGPLPAGTVTFHDRRGLIIDPLAVLSAVVDLAAAFPELVFTGNGGLTQPGGAGALLAALGTASVAPVRVHVITPHGGPLRTPGLLEIRTTSTGARIAPVQDAGPHPLAPGQEIAALDATPTGSGRTRVGHATIGVLGPGPYRVPPFPATSTYPAAFQGLPAPSLAYDFLRVCAVDLDFHLLGNRTVNGREGVGPADPFTASEPPPVWRDGVPLSYLPDGVAVLSAVQGQLAPLGPQTPFEAYLVSPELSGTFTIPPAAGAAGRWPAYPPPGQAGAQDFGPAIGRLRTDALTAYRGGAGPHDVVLDVAPGVLPAGAHLRAFPRGFSAGVLSRGDGAAGIVPASGQVRLPLPNPFGLAPGEPFPATPLLHLDLLVVTRPAGAPGRRRLVGGLVVPVNATGPAVAPGTGANAMLPLLDPANDPGFLGACHAGILGLPAPAPPSTRLPNPLDYVLALLDEGSPREAARYPTMARRESIAALRRGDTGAWSAVLTAGFLTPQSLTADLARGNPGGPAGPETHVTGVAAGGRLGYDLAVAAMRRARPLLPWPGGGSIVPPRAVAMANAAWDPASIPGTSSTMAGAALQTIAPNCETPELRQLGPDVDPGDVPTTQAGDWAALFAALGLPPDAVNIQVTNGDTIALDLRREFFAAAYGRRDAQWALRRAIAHARELVYVETAALAPTAYTDPPAAYAWDLVGALVTRLSTSPNLRAVLCLPKELDYPDSYGSWALQGYQARWQALAPLLTAFADRLVVCHPTGFPGRPLRIRSTVVTVDDVWCLVGASALRRRGLTFDGATDVVSTDRRLVDGRSEAVNAFRRQLMATHLHASAQPGDPTWARLADPAHAFAAFAEAASDGRLEPLWQGPASAGAQPPEIADPDGREIDASLITLVGLIQGVGA